MTEEIVLGGGCFWCIEAIFQRVKGVVYVESGYSGGYVDNPTYRQVCTEETGHAEVVRVRFEPEVISLPEILDIFFHLHDPTTLNRQGNDVGPQYRSIVFYMTEEQKNAVEKAIELAQPDWPDPIVTEVAPLTKFYVAEDYHQNYYNENTSQGYCNIVISPKLTKLREKYFEKLDTDE